MNDIYLNSFAYLYITTFFFKYDAGQEPWTLVFLFEIKCTLNAGALLNDKYVPLWKEYLYNS